MDGVGRNGADVRFNCSSICINDEHIRVQFGGHSLVETSCKPEPHVFHLGCITRHLDEQSETSLDQRRCSECEQTALPLIRKDGESDDDDESPYCESRMLNVCRSGNLRMLNRHLEKDKTLVNQPYRSALTGHPEYLLAVALKHQHTGLARTLIDHGADVNAADHQGETPLHTAARQRCTEVFNILIEAGANINNVLRTAVREGNDSLLEYLISTELSQSKLNIALREAAGQGRSQYLIPLMNKGANDLNGALREAAGQGQKQCLETLISPRVSQRTPDLNGALCAAAEGGQTECLRFLIEKGANELDLDHALNRAILARNNPSRTVLVEEGANITTVVHTAARKGDWEFFNYLNDPTEINATDGEGQTPLHITAANGDKTCLKKLIEKGANVNASNNNGETALHIATKISITKGRQQCAAMGIDITGNFINGKTFEHYTIEKENDIGCLCELADNRGVDFNARDNHGITPLMIATLWSKLDHLTYLLERADINIADNSGNTALHLAACWGQTDCLRKLLDKKVDVNVKTHTDGA
ncbi:ankyrin repeat domain-containing protein, partial [Salinisphaera sp. G21_0]|uniref:ankyrin repeat domain-containing protein n=1 Tax=Salinisphaera sp. G21_0 TaxID=2821094 RepID=UPI001AD99739